VRSGQLQLGPVPCASRCPSSAPVLRESRIAQLGPGAVRVQAPQLGPLRARRTDPRGKRQLGPVARAADGASSARQLGPGGARRTAPARPRCCARRMVPTRSADGASSARWCARQTAPARPGGARWTAPGGQHQLGPVLRAADGASSGPVLRAGQLQFGSVVCFSSAPWRPRRTAPPGPVRVRTRTAAVVTVPRSAGGLASDSSNSAPVGRAA
jgi:hypothetical protein